MFRINFSMFPMLGIIQILGNLICFVFYSSIASSLRFPWNTIFFFFTPPLYLLSSYIDAAFPLFISWLYLHFRPRELVVELGQCRGLTTLGNNIIEVRLVLVGSGVGPTQAWPESWAKLKVPEFYVGKFIHSPPRWDMKIHDQSPTRILKLLILV